MDWLEELDVFLSSDESPDGCMKLSDLDGFMHGVVCSPQKIHPQEWISVACGTNALDVPDWVIEEMLAHHGEIYLKLLRHKPVVEPIFWQDPKGHVIAMDWCEGFMKAVSLRANLWLRLVESGSHGHLVTPIIVHLMDENDIAPVGLPRKMLHKTLDKAAEQIPEAVEGIFQFWIDHS